MAFSAQLGEAGLTPAKIESTSTVTLEKGDGGFAVTAVQLDVVATVPGASEEAVLKAAQNAKEGCPISKLLKAPITMDAKVRTS
jgi:osmotically inducible protein OsmC